MPYNEQYCSSFQHAVELLGKRWTGLILKVLLAGPQRFGEIADQIEGVSDRMLSERLKEFEVEGLIERRVYAETPVRIEYRLTEKGQALDAVIEAIAAWGHTWIEAEETLVD
jgi:DNA-binding HxlR family transcriptional regulator